MKKGGIEQINSEQNDGIEWGMGNKNWVILVMNTPFRQASFQSISKFLSRSMILR